MPRGQKSKLRAREKRRQALEEPEDLVGVQTTEGVGEEFRSSYSPCCKGVSESLPAPGSCCNSQGLQRATSTAPTAAAVSYTRFNEGAHNQVEGRPRSSQAQPTTELSHRGPLDEKVFILVYYLLYKYQMKEPITKADMLRNVIQTYRNHFHEILKRASEHVELIFGLDMKEMDPYRHIYLLVNKLEPSCDGGLSDGSSLPKSGLLMIVLGVIFTKDNCATEEQMWQVLNMMGIYAGRRHYIYGEPRKLITQDLVKENYLEYRQVPHSDPPRYEFLWGPRAHAETSKMKVLEFVAKIHKTVPSAFPSWYAEALRDEEERARARAAARARIAAMASARSKATASARSRAKASARSRATASARSRAMTSSVSHP